jgi:hypothetical protein
VIELKDIHVLAYEKAKECFGDFRSLSAQEHEYMGKYIQGFLAGYHATVESIKDMSLPEVSDRNKQQGFISVNDRMPTAEESISENDTFLVAYEFMDGSVRVLQDTFSNVSKECCPSLFEWHNHPLADREGREYRRAIAWAFTPRFYTDSDRT